MGKVTSSYSCQIVCDDKSIRQILKDTICVYQDAITFVNEVIEKEKSNILSINESLDKLNYIEHLIHTTKNNKAKYPFDLSFYKMPSYLRRDVVSCSWGHMSSYYSNTENYKVERKNAIDNGKRFQKKPPKLNLSPNICPTFYKKNTYMDENFLFSYKFIEDKDNEDKKNKESESNSNTNNKNGNNDGGNSNNDNNNNKEVKKVKNIIYLKLFKKKDWVYVPIRLKTQDVLYIQELMENGYIVSNPTIYYTYGHYHLRFAVTKYVTLPDVKDPLNQVALAVDLGVNKDAVCSVMKGDGTIIARHFVNIAMDKDHLNHLLARRKKLQKESGNYKYAPLTHVDTKIQGYQDNICNQTCHKLMELALQYEVDVIVFEHLDSHFKKKKGHKRSERLNYWRKNRIIHMVCAKAHHYGIRYATICPYGTSKLAFDGSGNVLRGKDGGFTTNELCKFTNGKIYHCDLNASYNIGARYFLRCLENHVPARVWSEAEAKVPLLTKRTRRTYHTFVETLKCLKCA